MNIRYQEYMPSAALQPYVECYWHHVFDGEPTEVSPAQYCLPLGMLEFIHGMKKTARQLLMQGEWKEIPKSLLVGIWDETAIWRTTGGTEIFGVRLKPESLFQLFNMPASVIYMGHPDLESIFGKDIKELTDKLDEVSSIKQYIDITENFFLSKLKNLKMERNYVIEASRLIRESKGVLSIDELSDHLYISKRQLQRSFKEYFGTSPKTYQRIIRFSSAYHYYQKSKRPPSWADISYSFGYADQAHFIRDFKDFTGDVPTILSQKEDHFYQLKELAV